MDPKTAFGNDFLYILRTLQLSGSDKKEFDPISDAASRLFMLMWGFSPDEIDSISKSFFEKLKKGELDKFEDAFKRLVNHVKKDHAAIERLVIQSSAIAAMDFSLSEGEASILNLFQEELDLRPSEFDELHDKGVDLSLGLHFFGSVFAKNEKTK